MERPLKRRLPLWVLVLVTGALAMTGLAPARQAYHQRQVIREEESRLQELERKNAELESRLARLEDPAYREMLAREQLGMVRPGETAYVVVPPPAPATEPPAPKVTEKGWMGRMLDWLSDFLGLG